MVIIISCMAPLKPLLRQRYRELTHETIPIVLSEYVKEHKRAREVRKNDYMIIKGRACRVIETSHTK